MIKEVKKTIKNNLNIKDVESFQHNRVDILQMESQTDTICGVYVLMKNNNQTKECEITYVGFSTNLINRLKDHAPFSRDSKRWNLCAGFLIDSEKRAREVETCLIVKFKPQHNSPSTWQNPLKLSQAQPQYTNYIKTVKNMLAEDNSNYDKKKLAKHSVLTYKDWYDQQYARLTGEKHKLILL